jgi:nucleotidyltransferase/DNA polymerase involved in DNA repair
MPDGKLTLARDARTPGKTLAKLANHVAKKRSEWNGVFEWDWLNPREADRLLAEFAVGEVWGIGRRIAEKLTLMNIHSALDLKQADPRHIKRKFNVVVERTVAELNRLRLLTVVARQGRRIPPPIALFIAREAANGLASDSRIPTFASLEAVYESITKNSLRS